MAIGSLYACLASEGNNPKESQMRKPNLNESSEAELQERAEQAFAKHTASEPQVALIAKLLDQKNLLASPSFFDAVNAMDEQELAAYIAHIKESVKSVHKSRASEIISSLIALPNKERKERKAATVTEPGVYETDEGIFVVKFNKAKTNLYAKKMIEINAERATEAGERVEIEFEYVSGAIFRLSPEDKMPLEKAKQLTIRYGRCIVCGRRLKAAESVERGIGPVCIKSFA